MRVDIEKYVANCHLRKEQRNSSRTSSNLRVPLTEAPFDTISTDLFQLPQSHQGSRYLLVCVDHFSRVVVLAPIKSKTAQAVAHALVTHLIRPYTTSRVLLSDNGTEFSTTVIAEICANFEIAQTFTTPYHPASNGLVERANKDT